MKKPIQLLLFSLAIVNSGCSVIYDINQDRVAEYCESLLNQADRVACKQRNRTSYEEYEKERQKLKHGSEKK